MNKKHGDGMDRKGRVKNRGKGGRRDSQGKHGDKSNRNKVKHMGIK